MKTGFISSSNSLDHDTGEGHPENKFRIHSILDRLKKRNFKQLDWSKPGKFDEIYLKKTHESKYVEKSKKKLSFQRANFLDGDTVISPGSKLATLDAVSSIISAIDLVNNKKLKNAFVLLDHQVTMLNMIRQWVFVYLIMWQLVQII